MGKYLFVPLLLVVALLQTTVISRLTIHDVKPDLMLLLVVGETAFAGTERGMVWGLVGGLFLDLLSGGPFGALALILPLVALVTGTVTGESLRHRFMLPLVLVFIGSLLQGVLSILAVQLADRPVFWSLGLISVVLEAATLDTALMPLIYLVFSRWGPRSQRRAEPTWRLT